MIRKAYVDLPHGQVHYRIAGSGPPIVLLHDSPRSSAMHGPLLASLGAGRTVVALDTPGYGNSSPLPPEPVPDIPAFAEALARTLRALGIERCAVYGFHTSSKILLELAIRHPGLVSLALFDGLSLPAGGPDESFIAKYMAPYEVREDGSHFAAAWSRARDLHRFFPWYARTAAARLPIDLPAPDALHAYAMDLLMAGPHYSTAYAAAMRYQALPRLASLDVNAHFTCRANDPLYAYLDLVERHLPRRASVARLGTDHGAWLEHVTGLLRDATDGTPGLEARPRDARPRDRVTAAKGYADLHAGQLHFRRFGRLDAARTVLVLPELPGTGAGVADFCAALAAQGCHVYAVDLPGSGESTALTARARDAESHAVALKQWIAQLEIDALDLVAEFTAVPIALALARIDTRVRSVVADGLPPLEAETRMALREHYCPTLAPMRDGTHLTTLWHRLRDRELAWPWYDGSAAAIRRHEPRLDPAVLSASVVELGKQLGSHADACLAALDYDVASALRSLRQPFVALEDPRDLRYAAVSAAIALPRYVTRLARAQAVDERARDIVTALAKLR